MAEIDCAKEVADLFEGIIARCEGLVRPADLPREDQILYYIVSVRCEADMNGFCSVFEQLLSEDDLEFFVSALREIGESRLANVYERIGQLLGEVGYFPERKINLHDLPGEALNRFEALEQEAQNGDPLWELDSRLLALYQHR